MLYIRSILGSKEEELQKSLARVAAREQEALSAQARLREELKDARTKLRKRNDHIKRLQRKLEERNDHVKGLQRKLEERNDLVKRLQWKLEGEHTSEDPGWHRRVIGGMWEELGQMQIGFMREHGLLPQHYLLDIGCGALRGGIRFIPYLEPGHYYGVDKSQRLLDAGRTELEAVNLQDRRPVLRQMADFGFERLDRMFDYALALSVFTHVPLNSIIRCLINVDRVLSPGGVFYATFFENRNGKHFLDPLEQSDGLYSLFDADPYHYTRDDFEWACEGTGLTAEYIGDWGHPRGQVMMAFRKKA